MEKRFTTKRFGHPISQYYTIILYTAVGFLLIPQDKLTGSNVWFFIVIIPVVAVIVAYIPRLLIKSGVARVFLDEDSVQVGFIRIPYTEITKFVKVTRLGLMGPELQIFTSDIRPSMVIVLRELQNPNDLIDDLLKASPKASWKEIHSGFSFLDVGLIISLVLLVWIIIWKVFL